MLLDTHCHLTHERYRPDLPEVLERAHAGGVAGIIAVASHLEDARDVLALVEDSSGNGDGSVRVWGTAGVHPHEASGAPRDLRARLNEALDAHEGILAVGECGLDYHYDHSPRAVQWRVFELHLEVAGDRDLPVVVHCREAEDDMGPFVERAGAAGIRGVLHCFPGDLDLLASAVDAGWLVSFTGLVTFPSFGGSEAVRRVPFDRYMLETDGPYMAPTPHRGKRNEPAYVPLIRDRVTELRGESPEAIERATTATARRFFRIP